MLFQRDNCENVYGQIEYKELILPTADEMAKMWAVGIDKGEESLWEKLRDWMSDALRGSAASFAVSIETLVFVAEQELKKQREHLESEKIVATQRWEQVEREFGRLSIFREDLHESVLSSSGHVSEDN